MPAFLLDLGSPLGWDQDTYGADQKAQDDFLEELNIKTYNEFQNYLFWDVLQGLIKMFIIKMHLSKSMMEDLQTPMDEYKEQEAFDEGKNEHDKKVSLRLELEFETIDDERKDAMDVEEIKFKE